MPSKAVLDAFCASNRLEVLILFNFVELIIRVRVTQQTPGLKLRMSEQIAILILPIAHFSLKYFKRTYIGEN